MNKKKSKSILYIGNNLSKKTKYGSVISLLSELLETEGYSVIIKSDKINKVYRLIDMCLSVVKHKKNVDYILIDTYSTSNFYYAFLVSQLARILNVKYIPILHGGNLPKRIIKSKLLSKAIFQNSYKNIAPSNYLKFAFESQEYKTKYIPNIIQIKDYKFKERNFLRPKLFWVRAFKEIYNPTLAIKVLDRLKKKYPNAILCMVGPFSDNSYSESLKMVKKHKLEDSVEFTNVLSKEIWHKKSEDFDIFINTTNFDNTPVSVIEAMALGLTIVSTNVGGMPFLVENNKDGILVEKDNEKLMADVIINIIENNNSMLAKNARNKVEKFDWSIVKKEWLEILK